MKLKNRWGRLGPHQSTIAKMPADISQSQRKRSTYIKNLTATTPTNQQIVETHSSRPFATGWNHGHFAHLSLVDAVLFP